MSIYTPEIATKYGALDSAGCVDKMPYSAHVLREIGRSANRLTAKGQALANLVWPTRDTLGEEDGALPFEGLAWPYWSLLIPRIPISKRPYLNRASFRCRLWVDDGKTAYLQFGTRASPFQSRRRAGGLNVLTVLGTGAWADYDLDGVPIHDGVEEHLEVWVRGAELGALMSEGTYGANNAGAWTGLWTGTMEDTGSTWNVSTVTVSNMSDGGHVLSLENVGGDALVSPRDIVANSATNISFLPHLTANELSTASVGGYYQIYALVRIAVANVAMAAAARTA
jgi:hypothetical protein